MTKRTPTLMQILALGTSLLLGQQISQAAYSEPASYKSPKKTISLGSSGYGTGGWNDTWAFNKAINNVNKAGGGIVWVPKGDYRLQGVALKSNVHLKIAKGSTLTLHQEGSMFSAGTGVTNTSIRGSGGWFTTKIPNYKTARFLFATGVNNLMVAGMTIDDPHETVFSSFELTWNIKDNGTPNNITIKNVHCRNKEEYGYGLIQAQAASNSKFTNLRGHGGVPVRLETGWTAMNLKKQGGVFNISAQNITSSDGQAAVMLQPHTRRNGAVYLNGIHAVGSEFAVVTEKGGTWKYTSDQIKDNNLTAGNFEKLTLKNVDAVYRSSGVPTRYSHFSHYTANELKKVYKDSNEASGYSGPSIAVVGHYGDVKQFVNQGNITGTGGFAHSPVTSKNYSHPGWLKNRPSL